MSDPSDVPRIGRYLISGVIGTGAFATVYRATDERLGGELAIKLLAENHSLDLELRERFLREGRVLRRIDSQHVVAVHDAGENDRGQPYLVLELADRGELGARVRSLRSGGWSPTADDVRALAMGLAGAVAAVHRAGAVHRDLSPGNVLLRSTSAPEPIACSLLADDERLLVADLGMCKDLAANSGLTVAGGTHGFRPPEQRGGPGPVDPRADLWSLSAMLVWLLSGEPPTGADEDVDRHLGAAGLPAELGEVLRRGLADEAEARQPDAATWLDEVLRGVEPSPSLVAGPAGGPTSSTGLAPPDDQTAGAPTEGGGARPLGTARPDRPGVSRRVVVAAALVGSLLGGAGVVGVISLSADDRVSISDAGDGQVRVETTGADSTLAIVGPERVRVGDRVTFVAEVEGISSWVWLAPDGQLHPDSAGLEVVTTSPGVATIRVTALSDDGSELRVAYDLDVVDTGDPL